MVILLTALGIVGAADAAVMGAVMQVCKREFDRARACVCRATISCGLRAGSAKGVWRDPADAGYDTNDSVGCLGTGLGHRRR